MSSDENEGRSNENDPSTSLLDKMVCHAGLVGVGLGVLFWVLESFIHAFIFGERTFAGQLFWPSVNEIWMRLVIGVLLAGFGLYIQITINEIRKPKAGKTISPSVNLGNYIIWTVCFWSLVVCLSLAWGIYQQYHNAGNAANIEAISAFNKDLVYRRWVSGHGGVYVPVTEKTPANPYLSHIEERDITTSSGRSLTLVNPSYMTRQIHETSSDQYGIRGHITSLKPIRPENAADEWEKDALGQFSKGEHEVSSIVRIDGQKYLRAMWPLETEQSCLGCHLEQGYKVGDIRGGISVSVPMKPYLAIAWSNSLHLILGHGFLWLIGILGIVYGGKQIENQLSRRRQAEAKVSESERRMREMLENVQLITVMLDNEGTISFANNCLLETTGFKREEVVGSNWFEIFIPAEHRAEIRNVHQKVLVGELELVGHYENEILTRGGEKRLIHWSNTLFSYSSEGDIIGTTSIGEDITDRKQAEEAMLESEERFRNMMEQSPSVIEIYDMDGLQINVNKAYEELWGFPASQTVNKFNVLESKEVEETGLMDYVKKAYSGQTVTVPEYEFDPSGETEARGFGRKRWLSTRIYPLKDSNGNVKNIVITHEDITERKHAEDDLKASEERFRRIVEDQTEFIIRWLPDGTRTFANEAYCRYYGLSGDEVIGISFLTHISEEDREIVQTRVGSLSPENPVSSAEHRVVLPDGSIGWNHWTDRAFFDEEGKLIEYQSVGRDTTQSRRAEEMLRERERQLSLIYNTTTDIMALVKVELDDEFKILSVNKPFIDIVNRAGVKRAKVTNVSYEKFFQETFELTPDEMAYRMDRFKQVSLGKEVVRFEAVMLLPNGEEIIHETTLNPIIDESGECTHILAVVKDISDQKQAEERLKDSEKRSRAWLEHSPVCTKMVDLDFNLQYMSRAGIEGLKIDDITQFYGKPYPFDFYPESFRNHMTKSLEKVKETGEIIKQEASVVDTDGNELWFHSTLVPVNDDEGRIEYIIVVSMDTTERKKAEEKLAIFKRFAEASGQGLGMSDLKGEIIYCNKALCEVFLGERSLEDAIGKNVSVYYEAESKRVLEEEVLPDVLKGDVWTGEVPLVSIDGKVTPAIQSIFLISNDNGEPLYLANVITDISDRKKAEEQARQRQAEVAHMSRLSSIGELASGIAHEVNQPLCAATNYTSGCLRLMRSGRVVDDELIGYMESTLSLMERAGNIINSIKKFVRKRGMRRSTTNINDIVMQIPDFVNSDIRDAGISVNYELDEQLPLLILDPVQIEQVLLNLIVNAIEAMSESGIVERNLTISTRQTDEHVEVSVSDTGVGLPENFEEKVFESFYTTKAEGLGIGLSISHSIIEAHGGKFWAENCPGGGAKFTFALVKSDSVLDIPD